mgnify:CR=1 FL=1
MCMNVSLLFVYYLGSVVESFVFGFVRVCVNGKLQVMREEDLQNEDIKLTSIKGGGNFTLHSPYYFLNIFWRENQLII